MLNAKKYLKDYFCYIKDNPKKNYCNAIGMNDCIKYIHSNKCRMIKLMEED